MCIFEPWSIGELIYNLIKVNEKIDTDVITYVGVKLFVSMIKIYK